MTDTEKTRIHNWLLAIRDKSNLGIANDTYTNAEMIQKLDKIYQLTWEYEKKLSKL